MDKNRYFQIRSGKYTKTKVAYIQRLYSKWLWLVMTVYKPLFSDAAYSHHWLSVTIHFNRYNLCFYKYTECRDKCKPLYFIVLHIRVVPPSFSSFVECLLSDSTYWLIGHFRKDVTERMLNTKVVFFLGFLRFAVGFLCFDYLGYSIRWKKCSETELFAWKSVRPYTLYLFLALILMPQSFLNYTLSDIITVVKW